MNRINSIRNLALAIVLVGTSSFAMGCAAQTGDAGNGTSATEDTRSTRAVGSGSVDEPGTVLSVEQSLHAADLPTHPDSSGTQGPRPEPWVDLAAGPRPEPWTDDSTGDGTDGTDGNGDPKTPGIKARRSSSTTTMGAAAAAAPK